MPKETSKAWNQYKTLILQSLCLYFNSKSVFTWPKPSLCFTCQFVCLFFCLFVCLFVCLDVRLWNSKNEASNEKFYKVNINPNQKLFWETFSKKSKTQKLGSKNTQKQKIQKFKKSWKEASNKKVQKTKYCPN